MIVVGLTGSIGMGKSTVAQMFADEGAPVYDADAQVHRLYAKGGAAVPLVETTFNGVVRDGMVDRAALSARVLGDANALRRLEEIVHPLVGESRAGFFDEARRAGAKMVVLDIPLLFETGGEGRVDKVVVVSAPADVQRQRVLERPAMTEDKLAAILARQIPDAEKRRRADFVVDTGTSLDATRERVRQVIAAITNS